MNIEQVLLASCPKSPTLSNMEPETKVEKMQVVNIKGETQDRRIVRAYQCRGSSGGGFTDAMLAIGMTGARESLGLSLLFAKFNKDLIEYRKAVNALANYVIKHAPRVKGTNTALQFKECAIILAKLAVDDYCRTADIKKARCRCGGTGKVYDIGATKKNGEGVEKNCTRCHGTGLRATTTAAAQRAAEGLLQISRATWYRAWQDFYRSLITKCFVEAAGAENTLRQL
ncbi:antitermination protein [Hafnia alvei]|uniref:antitermination protein Q n=1 Tax=Hafnia alvei TaxID=569 RepID=UPI002DBE1B20|nr:antitermination protein [Hafnia alvei]MEB7890993.1 antitermination protein [Hafnia alvei]